MGKDKVCASSLAVARRVGSDGRVHADQLGLSQRNPDHTSGSDQFGPIADRHRTTPPHSRRMLSRLAERASKLRWTTETAEEIIKATHKQSVRFAPKACQDDMYRAEWLDE